MTSLKVKSAALGPQTQFITVTRFPTKERIQHSVVAMLLSFYFLSMAVLSVSIFIYLTTSDVRL